MQIINAVFAVLAAVAEWFVDTIPTLTAIFWTPVGADGGGSLTVLGVMALASLGVSVTLLLFNYVKDILTFRH